MPNDIKTFLEYLSRSEPQIVLSYWHPGHNELMPIHYKVDDLVENFTKGKPPISGKVKGSR